MTHHVMKMRLSQFGSARWVRLRRQDLRLLQRPPPKASYLFVLVSPQDQFFHRSRKTKQDIEGSVNVGTLFVNQKRRAFRWFVPDTYAFDKFE